MQNDCLSGQKGFLLITCGTLSRHLNFKFPHRSQNNGAYVSAKTSGKSKLDWRISFQISCPLYSPIRVYLWPHHKMLLNLYYQSWKRQTMLRKNSCQSLGLQYTQTCTALTVISLLPQCFEILRRTCWSSSNLNIFIRYSYSLESVPIKRPLHFIGTKQ